MVRIEIHDNASLTYHSCLEIINQCRQSLWTWMASEHTKPFTSIAVNNTSSPGIYQWSSNELIHLIIWIILQFERHTLTP